MRFSQLGKPRMYGGLYQYTTVVLYLSYTQVKISFNYCISIYIFCNFKGAVYRSFYMDEIFLIFVGVPFV